METKKNFYNHKYFKYIAGLLVIVAALVFISAKNNPQDNLLHVYFLNVGQGDSIYVRTNNNVDMLIDGGPDSSVLQELGKVMPYYDKKIDYVVLTHPHADHLAGLNEIIKRYEIGEIIETDAEASSAEYKEWLANIKAKNIPVLLAREGDNIVLNNETSFKIFWPNEPYAGKTIDNLNNTSVVGELVYQNFKVMLTGDAEKEVLDKIIKNHQTELKSQIYKVPHHCSKNATDVNFIKNISPSISVIELGANNKYGFPHKECTEALNNQNSNKVYRTDQNSTIEIISDGNNFWTK